MTFNINWDKNGVYLKFRGIVNAQDLIDANNYVISNKSFDQINYQIFDFLDIDEFDISDNDINILGMMDKSQSEFKSEMKVAMVSNDNNVIGTLREYNIHLEDSSWITDIFTDIESARSWVKKK